MIYEVKTYDCKPQSVLGGREALRRFLADSIGKGKQSVDAVLQPAKSAAGALVINAWALYVLLAAIFYHPDYPASVWPIAGGGILACLAVAANFGRWRLVVILASCIYLLFYSVRVGRMACQAI